MRWHLVREFEKYIKGTLEGKETINVAMVGGYSTDPELAVLRKYSKNLNVTYYGIDSDSPFEYVDINSWNDEKVYEQYDLVLCSQVIEHIWNIQNLFLFLEKLTRKAGYLWISSPYSNITHGSPDFFSSGYTPEFLSNNLGSVHWEFICIKRVGSRRNYYATHILGAWLSKAELTRPVLSYEIKPGTTLGVMRKFLSEFPGRLLLTLVENRITDNPRWSTESYVFAKKIDSYDL
jgi:SAM-dependent methyltransferase